MTEHLPILLIAVPVIIIACVSLLRLVRSVTLREEENARKIREIRERINAMCQGEYTSWDKVGVEWYAEKRKNDNG